MAASPIVTSDPKVPTGLVWPDPDRFTAESARYVLSLTFNQVTQDRAQELMDKNSDGLISAAEKAELEQIVNASSNLAIVQSKARLFLKRAGRV